MTPAISVVLCQLSYEALLEAGQMRPASAVAF